jgi:hypothetical protein
MNENIRRLFHSMTSARRWYDVPALALAVAFACAAGAQTPTGADPKGADPKGAVADPLAPLAWVEGCWRGSVNQREFREQWMPLRGGLLLGVSQTVMGGKTQGYEYLRLEARPEGVFYIATPSGKSEDAFKLTGRAVDRTSGRDDEIFTFENPANEFPRRIAYRRASGGWLYAEVEGKVGDVDRQVIYPMRRIDCATGAPIE